MTTIKVGVREFRERIASFLESDTPVAVLLSLGVARLSVSTFPLVESVLRQPRCPGLKEAADRLASALADVDEEELVADFKELRRRWKGASR